MHIEIGIISPDKLAYAAAGAAALLVAHAPALLRQPALWLRTALAGLFFSLLMQLWHLKVGPSELHLVGAMPIYLLFGFVPTLFGFGAGLLLQALLFEPQDMAHLAINFLSLGVPLLTVHHLLGRRLQRLTVASVLKLDALYYGGVTAMVGFWLTTSNLATPLAGWAGFAASYLLLVAVEPLVTVGLVALGGRLQPGRGRALLALALDESWQRRTGLAA